MQAMHLLNCVLCSHQHSPRYTITSSRGLFIFISQYYATGGKQNIGTGVTGAVIPYRENENR